MKAKSGSGKINRRKAILRAAEKLMVSRGLSGITTRQISEEAGCSEGALYVHFKSRLELLLAMLEESLPEMLRPLRTLQQQVGRGSPHVNLAAALRGIFRFHQRATPRVAGLFADPELHAAFRASLLHQNKGPHLSLKVLEDYIAAEQGLGRIDRRAEPQLAAYVLMSCSFFRAFSQQFFGRPLPPAWGKLVKQLIITVAPVADTTKRRAKIQKRDNGARTNNVILKQRLTKYHRDASKKRSLRRPNFL